MSLLLTLNKFTDQQNHYSVYLTLQHIQGINLTDSTPLNPYDKLVFFYIKLFSILNYTVTF